MRNHTWMMLALSFCILLAGCLKTVSPDGMVPRIAREEVRAMLGQPDVIILDVRLEEEWKKSEWKIGGAIHEDPENLKSWSGKYPNNKTLIFYCS